MFAIPILTLGQRLYLFHNQRAYGGKRPAAPHQRNRQKTALNNQSQDGTAMSSHSKIIQYSGMIFGKAQDAQLKEN